MLEIVRSKWDISAAKINSINDSHHLCRGAHCNEVICTFNPEFFRLFPKCRPQFSVSDINATNFGKTFRFFEYERINFSRIYSNLKRRFCENKQNSQSVAIALISGPHHHTLHTIIH